MECTPIFSRSLNTFKFAYIKSLTNFYNLSCTNVKCYCCRNMYILNAFMPFLFPLLKIYWIHIGYHILPLHPPFSLSCYASLWLLLIQPCPDSQRTRNIQVSFFAILFPIAIVANCVNTYCIIMFFS